MTDSSSTQLAEVVVYTRQGCSYCSRLLGLLGQQGVRFTHHDLTGNQAKRDWLANVTGSSTVPQMFINGTPVGGCTDVEALHRSGKLAPLLAVANT